MKNMRSRLQRLEKEASKSFEDVEEGARQLVNFCVQFGFIDPSSDIEACVRDCVRKGLTVSRLLKDIPESRGLPWMTETFDD